MTESKLETALQLVDAGIPVYPLQTNGTKPISAHGFHDAALDVATVKRWFDNNRRFNIGIALESNHLLIVDIDVNHKSKLDGLSSYRKLAAEYDRLTENTYIMKTPHGGLHYFFRHPTDIHIKSTALCKFSEPKLAAYTGIDIQANGTPYAGTTTASGCYQAIDNGVTSPLDSAECLSGY
ncbi:bifunctional DNA primase/polymerase [Secundilactobacillus similis]|uniref:bifunctional DNA primase/polymerase n=1 Tax=Secundilactobacillus similis TaxID=414682 RepID=UPI0006D2468B|nr:bifunctional DNA primase/polymerase [Secundilactobacillus similis]